MSLTRDNRSLDHDLYPGAVLAPAIYRTSKVQVFRFSAATWNTHRIHYDKDYAVAEGYPDVLVQSHLHGAFLTRYCTDLVAGEGKLAALSLRVRRFAIAGEELTVTGTVTAVAELDAGRASVELELTETRGSDGETCVTGTARIEVPLAWTDHADGKVEPSEPELSTAQRGEPEVVRTQPVDIEVATTQPGEPGEALI